MMKSSFIPTTSEAWGNGGEYDLESNEIRPAVFSTSKQKLSPQELEDQFLKLREENLLLKKNSNQQEERIKQMTTRLIKITQDSRREGPRVRDTETEILVEELRSQLRDTKQMNEKLTRKMNTLIASQSFKKPSRYDSVPSRVDSRPTKKLVPYKTTGSMRSTPQNSVHSYMIDNMESQGSRGSGIGPDQLMSILISNPSTNLSNEDHKTLQDVVLLLTRKIIDQDRAIQQTREESDILKNELNRIQEVGMRLSEDRRKMEEELNKQRQEFLKVKEEHDKERSNMTPRANKEQHSVELLNLQKDLRERIAKVNSLQSSLDHAEASLASLRDNHTNLITQTTLLNSALKDERKKVLQLEQQLKSSGSNAASYRELNAIIDDLRDEKKKLEEAHNKLRATLHTEIDQKENEFEKERSKWRMKQEELEARTKLLEQENYKSVENSKELVEKLDKLRNDQEKLRSEREQLQVQLFQSQQEAEELANKLTFFTSETGVEITEIQQALTFLKLKKVGLADDSELLDPSREKRELDDLRCANAELVQEMDKLQKLLSIQKKIDEDLKGMNDQYKIELDRVKNEYEQKLSDEARLLDIKSDRIRKLEAQLNNYIYKRVKLGDGIEEEVEPANGELDLADDENAFEITITGASFVPGQFTPEAELDTFVSCDFFEYETMVTPVVSGLKPSYNFVARYKLKVDDFCLFYLKHYNIPFEISLAQGLDSSLLGTCFVSLRDCLEKTGKLYGASEIVSSADNVTVIGTLQYAFRFLRPIAEEVRIWKTKMTALNLLEPEGTAKYQRHMINSQVRNELVIKIVSCRRLLPLSGEKPAVFVHYQFYEFLDHYTPIVHSFDPIFDDDQSYQIVVTSEFEEYLLTHKLEFFVFDDNDTKGDFYFGSAEISLATLLHDKMIRGEYTLKNNLNESNGTINIEVYWRHPYVRLAVATASQASRLPLLASSIKNPTSIITKQPTFQKAEKKSDLNRSQPTMPSQQSIDYSPPHSDEEQETEPGNNNRDENETEGFSSLKLASRSLMEQLQQMSAQSLPEEQEKKGKARIAQQSRPSTVNSNTRRDDSNDEDDARSDFESEQDSNPMQLSELDTPQRKGTNVLTNNRRPPSPAARRVPKRPPRLRSPKITQTYVEQVDPKEGITIVIEKLVLDDHVLDSDDVERIFVAFEFLQYPISDLETHAIDKNENPFVFDFTRVFMMQRPNVYKLYRIMTSDVYSEANIYFDVCNEKVIPNQTQKQCLQLGTAVVNLHQLLDYGSDIIHQDIPVRDQYDQIGTLYVTVIAFEALREVIKRGELASSQ